MLQCKDCEFFSRDDQGRMVLRCDPFSTIKEPECLQKWQLLRLDGLFRSYQVMLNWYHRMSPMQEKMLKFMEHEMNDLDDADSWKNNAEDPDDADGNEGDINDPMY